MERTKPAWSCPVCGGRSSRAAFRTRTVLPGRIEAAELKPSATAFGSTAGEVVRCTSCGHGSLREIPPAGAFDHAYAHVEDATSALEGEGQIATSRRDLTELARHVDGERGRLLDVGCWTGSLLSAARELGWEPEGIDPSAWAVARAVEHGHRARQGVLDDADLRTGSYQVVTCCDVLEHLPDPAAASKRLHDLLEPGGFLFATVPDSGSLIARVLGARWWSVLPMHVQYFTRESILELLRAGGFEVVAVRTHPKVFSRRYYADRFGEFAPVVGPLVARFVSRSRGADRPVGPDFRDRLAVIARRRRARGAGS